MSWAGIPSDDPRVPDHVIRERQSHYEAAVRASQVIAKALGGVSDIEFPAASGGPPGVILVMEYDGYPVKVAVIAYPREDGT